MTSHRLIKTYLGYDKIKDLPEEYLPLIVEGLNLADKYFKICRLLEDCIKKDGAINENDSLDIYNELKHIREIEKTDTYKRSFTKINQLARNYEPTHTTTSNK